MNFGEKLHKFLEEQALDPSYINPHALIEVYNIMEEYYNIEDEKILNYINTMWET